MTGNESKNQLYLKRGRKPVDKLYEKNVTKRIIVNNRIDDSRRCSYHVRYSDLIISCAKAGTSSRLDLRIPSIILGRFRSIKFKWYHRL
jgi:hypothetical protein